MMISMGAYPSVSLFITRKSDLHLLNCPELTTTTTTTTTTTAATTTESTTTPTVIGEGGIYYELQFSSSFI